MKQTFPSCICPRKMEVEEMSPPPYCFFFRKSVPPKSEQVEEVIFRVLIREYSTPRCSSQSGCVHSKLKPGRVVLPNRNVMSGFVSESCDLLMRAVFGGCLRPKMFLFPLQPFQKLSQRNVPSIYCIKSLTRLRVIKSLQIYTCLYPFIICTIYI